MTLATGTPSPWFVYLVRTGAGALYAGISTDPERRLRQHQSGKGARALRGKGPLTLVWRQGVADKGAALRLGDLAVSNTGLADIALPVLRDLVLAPMMRGDINQSSFAFRVSHDGENWYQDDEGIVIREISKFSRLFDVSPVTYPAYQEADSGVRSMKAWQEARNSGALQNAINQRMARERLLTLLNA